MSELLPCPFCGGEGYVEPDDGHCDGLRLAGIPFVRCAECGCHVRLAIWNLRIYAGPVEGGK